MMISDSRLHNELDAGETLLWSGAPSPSSAATRGIGQSVAGVFVTGFALFWMSGAYWATSQAPRGFGPPGAGLFPLFGLIFVFVGLGLIFSTFFNAQKATRTLYVVTDRRLLIIEGQSVQSFLPSDLESLKRSGDERGDVVFASEMRRGNKGRHYSVDIGFFGIENPRVVEGLIRQHLKR
jgi:hypothetical protein